MEKGPGMIIAWKLQSFEAKKASHNSCENLEVVESLFLGGIRAPADSDLIIDCLSAYFPEKYLIFSF